MAKKKGGDRSMLKALATMLGVGGTAEKIIDRDEQNTKAGKLVKRRGKKRVSTMLN